MLLFSYKSILVATVVMLKVTIQSNSDLHHTQGPIGIMKTSSGAAISKCENTLNTRLIFNKCIMDDLSRAVRERLPERVVHAKGTGAYGHFTVTHNISSICRAKVFSEDGKRTPIVIRFSATMAESGSSDTFRDPRGFTVRFYTEDGNFDLVGLNIPIFVTNDPNNFSNFVRSQKRNPTTNLHDPNMMWDFLTLYPASLHMFFYILGDYGLPNGFGHMPGFGVHTFQVENAQGTTYFVKFHMTPDSGIRTLTSEEGRQIQEFDFGYNIRDLYRTIEKGYFPVWTLSVQVLTLEDVKRIGSIAFDITRVISMDKFPLIPIGKLVLNRNPTNMFAEIEELAMNPINLVDGILGAPDTLFQSRALVYREAQFHRLGVNFYKIPVNCPFQTRPLIYDRDGRPQLGDNERDILNCFKSPVPYNDINRVPLIQLTEGKANNTDQVRDLYMRMTINERNRLIENILSGLGLAAKLIQKRAIQLFKNINSDLGERIEQRLLGNITN